MVDVEATDHDEMYEDCYTKDEYRAAEEDWQPQDEMEFPFYAKYKINGKLKDVKVVDVNEVKYPKIMVNIRHGKFSKTVDITDLQWYVCDEDTYGTILYCLNERGEE